VFSEGERDLAKLLQALLKTAGLGQFLHELAVLAADAVSGGMSCGIALRQHARPSSVTACADRNDQLRSSIVSRAIIDQALGVIMATERCPQDKAFAMLRSVSQNTNVKLRDLAATIVTSVTGEPPTLTTPFEDGGSWLPGCEESARRAREVWRRVRRC
jgi:hypothetical protein